MESKAPYEPVMAWDGVWDGGLDTYCVRCGGLLTPGAAIKAQRKAPAGGGLCRVRYTHQFCPGLDRVSTAALTALRNEVNSRQIP